jgi:hypothetical protein
VAASAVILVRLATCGAALSAGDRWALHGRDRSGLEP